MDCTSYVLKTMALVSCVVTAHLICVLVFVYAKAEFFIPRLNYTKRSCDWINLHTYSLKVKSEIAFLESRCFAFNEVAVRKRDVIKK